MSRGPLIPPEVLETVSLAAAARVVQVHQSDDPALSDLSLYPYSFRTLRSMEAITRGSSVLQRVGGQQKINILKTTPTPIKTAHME